MKTIVFLSFFLLLTTVKYSYCWPWDKGPTTTTTATEESDHIIVLSPDKNLDPIVRQNSTNGSTDTTTPTTTTTTTVKTIPPPFATVPCSEMSDTEVYCGACEKLKPSPKPSSFSNVHYFLMAVLTTLIIFFVMLVAYILFFNDKDPETSLTSVSSDMSSSSSKTNIEMALAQETTCIALTPNDKKKKNKFDPRDPKNRHKLRKYIESREKRDEEDAKSSKFKKKGRIYIPRDVDSLDFKKIKPSTKNVKLKKVYYDQRGNLEFDIGSDIDDIELASDTMTMSKSNTVNSMMGTPVNVEKRKKENKKPIFSLDRTYEMSKERGPI